MAKRIHIKYSGEEYWVTQEQLEMIQKESQDGIAFGTSQGRDRKMVEDLFRVTILKDEE